MRYFVLFLSFWILPVLAQSFLPGTEDIPLMEGLIRVEETASFDNPSERMVLISAQTRLSSQKVFQFYKESLSNLGWRENGQGKFDRGTDSFSIEISGNGSVHQIQFRLSQRNP